MINYARKAWEVIGYTLDGEPYCKECPPKGEEVAPIFAVDLGEFRGYYCDTCQQEIK